VDPDIYSVQTLIRNLGLTQDPKRNLRKDKENESVLMGLNLSAPVKLATFELGLVHPQNELDNMREVALTLEDML